MKLTLVTFDPLPAARIVSGTQADVATFMQEKKVWDVGNFVAVIVAVAAEVEIRTGTLRAFTIADGRDNMDTAKVSLQHNEIMGCM